MLEVLSVAKIVHSINNIRIMRQTPLRRSQVGLPVFKHHIPWSGILPSWANRWAKTHSGPPLAPPVTILYIWVPLRVFCLAFYTPNFEILHYNLLHIKSTKSIRYLKVQSHLFKPCLRQDICHGNGQKHVFTQFPIINLVATCTIYHRHLLMLYQKMSWMLQINRREYQYT